ncbi:hypothetical protein GGX14DRAFT_593648 [Mycena pura]|uniref:Uncharacterized protein n=1 Tax=Mycena pura TaxID=153505 RepID=A0AAD6UQW1_9AGAR|nr:hypothetical protein GGX14DRAFT_593648 [Mycena pura]
MYYNELVRLNCTQAEKPSEACSYQNEPPQTHCPGNLQGNGNKTVPASGDPTSGFTAAGPPEIMSIDATLIWLIQILPRGTRQTQSFNIRPVNTFMRDGRNTPDDDNIEGHEPDGGEGRQGREQGERKYYLWHKGLLDFVDDGTGCRKSGVQERKQHYEQLNSDWQASDLITASNKLVSTYRLSARQSTWLTSHYKAVGPTSGRARYQRRCMAGYIRKHWKIYNLYCIFCNEKNMEGGGELPAIARYQIG